MAYDLDEHINRMLNDRFEDHRERGFECASRLWLEYDKLSASDIETCSLVAQYSIRRLYNRLRDLEVRCEEAGIDTAYDHDRESSLEHRIDCARELKKKTENPEQNEKEGLKE